MTETQETTVHLFVSYSFVAHIWLFYFSMNLSAHHDNLKDFRLRKMAQIDVQSCQTWDVRCMTIL